MARTTTSITILTAPNPGAVGIIQLAGPDATRILGELAGITDWRANVVRLVELGGVDRGLAVVIQEHAGPSLSGAVPGKLAEMTIVQLMPHGGPRVIQKIVGRLIELGAEHEPNPPAKEIYPEASSDLEADMLATLAQAASPAAIDLLLAQPKLWRDYLARLGEHGLPAENTTGILSRSDLLNRLITPASVLVCGRPNVGKSTLTNRLLGRSASIVSDLPGTTRDWVAGLTEFEGVAIRWMDTPGLRRSDDPIEQAAIEIATGVIAGADLLIAMRDPQIDWPQPGTLPREPDLWIMNKIDEPSIGNVPRADATRELPLPISAATGAGLGQLQKLVLGRLGLADLSHGCWAFSSDLRRLLGAGDMMGLRAYARCRL